MHGAGAGRVKKNRIGNKINRTANQLTYVIGEFLSIMI